MNNQTKRLNSVDSLAKINFKSGGVSDFSVTSARKENPKKDFQDSQEDRSRTSPIQFIKINKDRKSKLTCKCCKKLIFSDQLLKETIKADHEESARRLIENIGKKLGTHAIKPSLKILLIQVSKSSTKSQRRR